MFLENETLLTVSGICVNTVTKACKKESRKCVKASHFYKFYKLS